ncbi:MAG: FtsB family cell division protein [Myxococcaceae bacterium]
MKRRLWRWSVLLVAAVLVGVSLADADGFRRYGKLSAEVSALETKNADLAVRNRVLEREVRALREDLASIERAAREELGFVRPGEIVLNLE